MTASEYAEAIRSLKALIDRFPEDPDVHLLLLSAYRKDENYQKAFETSLDLLERFPDYPLVLYNGGLDLEIMGRFQEAETHLRKLLPMIQGDPELMAGARLGLARVLAHQKKTVEAAALFEEAIRLNQGGVPALADLSDIYLKAGEFEKAAEAAQASGSTGAQEKTGLHPTGQGVEEAGKDRRGQRADPHLSATEQG